MEEGGEQEEEMEEEEEEEEGGEEDHGERSCFYSLSFLAEAKDTLSTVCVCVCVCVCLCVSAGTDNPPLCSAVLCCIVNTCVLMSVYNNYIITVSVKKAIGETLQDNAQTATRRVRAHARV